MPFHRRRHRAFITHMGRWLRLPRTAKQGRHRLPDFIYFDDWDLGRCGRPCQFTPCPGNPSEVVPFGEPFPLECKALNYGGCPPSLPEP